MRGSDPPVCIAVCGPNACMDLETQFDRKIPQLVDVYVMLSMLSRVRDLLLICTDVRGAGGNGNITLAKLESGFWWTAPQMTRIRITLSHANLEGHRAEKKC